jgi:hypothetical protein
MSPIRRLSLWEFPLREKYKSLDGGFIPMATTPLIPAAQYLRMSSDQPKWSFQYQAAAIESYAEARGFRVVKTCADPGIRVLTLRRRRGLAGLLHAVVSGTADFRAILVYDVRPLGEISGHRRICSL